MLRIGRLVAVNQAGQTLTVQPAEESGLVLLAPVSGEGLRRLRQDGYRPAAVVETGPGRYEAWVRLSEQPIDARLARAVTADLAARYSAAAGTLPQAGHLAGFALHTPGPGQRDTDIGAVATVREARGRVAAEAPALLARATLRIAVAALTEEERPEESHEQRPEEPRHDVDHSRGDR
jgi:hypothetical protein